MGPVIDQPFSHHSHQPELLMTNHQSVTHQSPTRNNHRPAISNHSHLPRLLVTSHQSVTHQSLTMTPIFQTPTHSLTWTTVGRQLPVSHPPVTQQDCQFPATQLFTNQDCWSPVTSHSPTSHGPGLPVSSHSTRHQLSVTTVTNQDC